MTSDWQICTYLGERSDQGRLKRALDNRQLQALSSHYGLKFNGVEIRPTSDGGLVEYPDKDLVSVSFNLSGSEETLLRHQFLRADWIERVPRCGVINMVRTEGFGTVFQMKRTASGYRICSGRYDDALEKLAPLMALVEPATARFFTQVSEVRP